MSVKIPSSFYKNFVTSLFSLFFLIAPAVYAQPNFDHDRQADFGVYRAENRTWYSYSSEQKRFSVTQFGLNTDVLAPADYDGDGITDVAVWRPSNGVWYVLRSRDNQLFTIQWGTTVAVPFGEIADIPVPFDYDGDRQADIAVYRPDPGVWYILESTQNYNPAYAQISHFGGLADVPVPADYDGDGAADIAVYRTTGSRWYIWESASGNFRSLNLGLQGADLLVPADYDGDGKADPAVYRSGNWIVAASKKGAITGLQFGNGTDRPVPADYDGDGRADYAVFRQGTWYVWESKSQQMKVFNFGAAGDFPVNSAYVRESVVAVP